MSRENVIAHAEEPVAVRVPQLREIYLAHSQTVSRWAFRLGGPSADVDDIVQEVFLLAQRKLGALRDAGSLRPWLYRITANEVHRRRRRERLWWWLRGSPEDYANEVGAGGRTPYENLESRQATELTYRILDSMAGKYRTVLILFQLEGMSGEQISALTGTRLATVWVHLHRARADFLRRLQALQGASP
ncbi:MAG: RNA polymerase sigma factor [Myxococcaceae bacterium]